MKDALLRLLERLGLLRPSYRAYERLRALRAPSRPVTADGLAVPPPALILRVAGTPDAEWFLESGRAAAESIGEQLRRNGVAIEGSKALLDFGCGCGRVTRYWRRLESTTVRGSDYNPALVAWCQANLTFAEFSRNELAPPLPYGDGAFDLVYALSVLTHLPESLQDAWRAELRRVLEPGGHLVLSLHGERYRERLRGDERRRFDAGELVVRWEGAAGTNLCTVFHPERYVRERTAGGFELVEFLPEGARGNPHQDLVLLRKVGDCELEA